MRIDGARVLITGASRGIGAGLARGVADRGGRVALVARSAGAIEELAAELGGDAYPCDVSDRGALEQLAARAEADGPVDLLVNNAGVANVGWYSDRTLDEIEQVLTVNLVAPMLLTRLLLPGMLERDRGHVVNISSMAAVFAPPGLTSYGASKAGLSHFTAGLRADHRDDPLAFTVVHLASVKTEMDDEARSYGPLRELAEQSGGRDVTPMADFVSRVLDGIERDEAEINVPRFMAPLAATTNLPRQLGKLMFKRAMVRELREGR